MNHFHKITAPHPACDTQSAQNLSVVRTETCPFQNRRAISVCSLQPDLPGMLFLWWGLAKLGTV